MSKTFSAAAVALALNLGLAFRSSSGDPPAASQPIAVRSGGRTFNSEMKLQVWLFREGAACEMLGVTPAAQPLAIPGADDWGVDVVDRPADVAALVREMNEKQAPGVELWFWATNEDVAASIAGVKGLRTLGVHSAGVTDAGLEHLSDAKALRSLELTDAQVTDGGLAQLQELRSVETLRLCGCRRLTDAMLATVGK